MRWSLIILCLLVAVGALAQSFTAKLSKPTVAIGEQFQITYAVDAKGEQFQAPSFGSLQLFSGPNTSVSYMNVNGKSSISRTYSFILAATRAGTIEIEPASINVGGKIIKSNSLSLQVSNSVAKAPNQPQHSQRHGSQPQASEPTDDDLSANLFLKLFVSDREVYVGEQLLATYKLYINVNIRDYGINRPVYNGFYAEEIEQKAGSNVVMETINGTQFKVATVKQVLLTAQQTGELTLPAIEMPMVVDVRENRKPRSYFDQMFGMSRQVKVDVKSNSATVKVLPLPSSGQPASFDGAVGNFAVRASVDKTEVKVNEAINFTVVVEGKGNLDLLGAPAINFPSDFESYDPKLKETVSHSATGTTGKKTYEYVLIPRHAGDFNLESIELPYFDSDTKTYKVSKTDPIIIAVTKGSEEDETMATVAPSQEQVVQLGTDVRYIKTKAPSPVVGSGFYKSLMRYGLQGAPFALLALAGGVQGWQRSQQGQRGAQKIKRAGATALKQLTLAEKKFASSPAEVYQAVAAALQGYATQRFSLKTTDLSRESLAETLREKGTNEEAARGFLKVIDDCEMARFAPGAVPAPAQMLTAARQAIQNLEREV